MKSLFNSAFNGKYGLMNKGDFSIRVYLESTDLINKILHSVLNNKYKLNLSDSELKVIEYDVTFVKEFYNECFEEGNDSYSEECELHDFCKLSLVLKVDLFTLPSKVKQRVSTSVFDELMETGISLCSWYIDLFNLGKLLWYDLYTEGDAVVTLLSDSSHDDYSYILKIIEKYIVDSNFISDVGYKPYSYEWLMEACEGALLNDYSHGEYYEVNYKDFSIFHIFKADFNNIFMRKDKAVITYLVLNKLTSLFFNHRFIPLFVIISDLDFYKASDLETYNFIDISEIVKDSIGMKIDNFANR